MRRLTKHSLKLSTSEPLSNTTVSTIAVTESLLGSTFAVHVESVRIREDFLIPIS